MSVIELFILSLGLAMDALAVSIAKSSTIGQEESLKKVILPLIFGIFQAIMPLIGALVGVQFAGKIDEFDHWIIFAILGYLGVNMIRASLKHEEDDDDSMALGWKEMMLLAIATSIDALAVGVSIAFLKVDIYLTSALIGLVTFFVCLLGTTMGKHLMKVCRDRAELVGGVILILVGFKILMQHLGFINW